MASKRGPSWRANALGTMVTVAALHALPGCGAVATALMDPKLAVAAEVSHDLGCKPEDVEYVREPSTMGVHQFLVRGCKQSALYHVLRNSHAVLVEPRYASAHARSLAMRASFKLDCHPREITIESADAGRSFDGVDPPSRAIARGCGASVKYVWQAGAFVED